MALMETKMHHNILRSKLESGKPTLGTHVMLALPEVIEALGHTGIYDYVEFVAEYGDYDMHDLANIARASELYGLGTMIKVDKSHQEFTAQRAVGSGFNCVLYTDARSANDVREALKITNPDSPEHKGLYGCATRRNAYIDDNSPEYVNKIASTVKAVMIEKQGAVDELDEILEIPGIDLVQWGGGDFSQNIGHPGEQNHPIVKAAHDKVFKESLRAGIQPRAEIESPDEVKMYLDMGVKHFSIGTDISMLYSWWKNNGEDVLRSIEGE